MLLTSLSKEHNFQVINLVFMFEISERAHVGLLLMAALAQTYETKGRVRLKQVAEDARVSLAYLEEIAALLREAGLIEGRQGPGGGYRLMRIPVEITLEEISTALEGEVSLVACQKTAMTCPHEQKCRTKQVWHRLQRTIQAQLKSITLQEVI